MILSGFCPRVLVWDACLGLLNGERGRRSFGELAMNTK